MIESNQSIVSTKNHTQQNITFFDGNFMKINANCRFAFGSRKSLIASYNCFSLVSTGAAWTFFRRTLNGRRKWRSIHTDAAWGDRIRSAALLWQTKITFSASAYGQYWTIPSAYRSSPVPEHSNLRRSWNPPRCICGNSKTSNENRRQCHRACCSDRSGYSPRLYSCRWGAESLDSSRDRVSLTAFPWTMPLAFYQQSESITESFHHPPSGFIESLTYLVIAEIFL